MMFRKRNDGTELEVPRSVPALTKDAYPKIFENQPSYLSTEPPAQRTEPEERRARLEERELQFQQFIKEDQVPSYEDFLSLYSEKLKSELTEWTVITCSESIHFLKYNSNCKKVDVVIVVNNNLCVQVFSESAEVPLKKFSNFLGKGCECNSWMKFTNLFNHFKEWKVSVSAMEDKLQLVSSILKACISEVQCSVCGESSDGACECESNNEEQYSAMKKVAFLQEQVHLLTVKRPTYSPETMIWAFSIYLGSPSAYCDMRDSQVLTLPHPMYLKKFSKQMGANQSGLNVSHAKYLKEKCKRPEEHERIVIVMLDEVYVRGGMSYKGGRIEGRAINCKEEATAVQTFMLASITSKNRDVAGLFPVKNQTAKDLLKFTEQILKLLFECGYKVFALISDNHRINRTMFTMLGNGKLMVKIKNPAAPNDDLFLFFECVHLRKTIRNNWFNQSDSEQEFLFPNFGDFCKVERASVKHLKDLYRQEANLLVKLAPGLSQKVLYPSSTEKQNVVHAVKLFDEKTIAALDKIPEAQGTKMFLEIVMKWWRIVNVKHPYKGIHLRDEFQKPITSVTQDSLTFLGKFVKWLNAWQNLQCFPNANDKSRAGKLTAETQVALVHTMKAFIELSRHLLLEKILKYILLGKFQTDKIEARFGLYRQLRGANYHITVEQVLKTEKS